ncbi:MAG: 5'/3'-nucleotidase SurE [Ardenticatenia bacterium]|nr:5'/3'-nucleotidase SurE [Ardenticatenia bacterium]
MTTTPLIFVTNDDGIVSPGLRAAVEAVHDLGALVVVAPRTQQTAASRSFPPRRGTVDEQTIRLSNGEAVRAWAVDGTPAQAVRWGDSRSRTASARSPRFWHQLR